MGVLKRRRGSGGTTKGNEGTEKWGGYPREQGTVMERARRKKNNIRT